MRAAFSALTMLGVFLELGVLDPTLETDLASSLSATASLVTLRALFIRSALGVFTETDSCQETNSMVHERQ